jgi:hypothetical protein
MSLDSDGSDAIVTGHGNIHFNSDNILPLPAADILKIIKWLQPTLYESERSEYSRHHTSHLVGIGEWLTYTDGYHHWHSVTTDSYGSNALASLSWLPQSSNNCAKKTLQYLLLLPTDY